LSHALFGDARLYVALLEIDRDLRDERRVAGCACGGPLHVSDYPRKPRGVPAVLPEDYDRRLSLCCARCRRRTTPPSVRFLGRRVYLAGVVVLASAMRHGLSAHRVAELRALIGVSRRTLERWRHWWLELFTVTPLWKELRGRLSTPVDLERLPASLLERFAGGLHEQLVAMLKQLSPLSVPSPPSTVPEHVE
jgi:hypothetical protein